MTRDLFKTIYTSYKFMGIKELSTMTRTNESTVKSIVSRLKNGNLTDQMVHFMTEIKHGIVMAVSKPKGVGSNSNGNSGAVKVDKPHNWTADEMSFAWEHKNILSDLAISRVVYKTEMGVNSKLYKLIPSLVPTPLETHQITGEHQKMMITPTELTDEIKAFINHNPHLNASHIQDKFNVNYTVAKKYIDSLYTTDIVDVGLEDDKYISNVKDDDVDIVTPITPQPKAKLGRPKGSKNKTTERKVVEVIEHDRKATSVSSHTRVINGSDDVVTTLVGCINSLVEKEVQNVLKDYILTKRVN